MSKQEKDRYSRRDFLKLTGATAAGVYVATVLPGKFLGLNDGVLAIPVSEGFLLVDSKKCSGCMSCMLACSLVHEGKENLCLSRIQIISDSFGKFPDDITMAQCRHCVDSPCVRACSTGALHLDEKHGNVRAVDERKCIGCMRCIQACPFEPSRARWNRDAKHAQGCDLCLNTPHWKEQGGPEGKQACVEICSMRAIRFTDKVPIQKGDSGYNVNLRNEYWRDLAFSDV